MVDSSAPPFTFNEISTIYVLAARKLFPVVHVKSKLLVVITHALCSAPTVTVTSGKVAIYSTIPPFVPVLVIEGVKAVGLGDFGGRPVSRNFTLDASPLFAVTIATTSVFS
jgi:hypothetical protein